MNFSFHCNSCVLVVIDIKTNLSRLAVRKKLLRQNNEELLTEKLDHYVQSIYLGRTERDFLTFRGDTLLSLNDAGGCSSDRI